MLYRRDRRLLKAQRAKFFDLCLDMFQAYRVTQDGAVYPLLSGRYRDHEVRLEPLIDNMAWRKVPVAMAEGNRAEAKFLPGHS